MIKRLKDNFLGLLLLGIILFVFRFWFTSNVVCKGDCVYFFPDNLKSFFSLPYFWNTSPFGSGMGYFALPTLMFAPPSFFLGTLYYLFNFDFTVIEKIAWFFPFLILSSSGFFYLAKVLKLEKIGTFFGAFFYLLNTYILLVLDGGQVGIALAYSLTPWSFSLFIKSLEENYYDKILSGFFLSLLIFFDLRVAYLNCLLFFAYSLFCLIIRKNRVREIILSWFFVFLIPLAIHFFWIGSLIKTNFAGISGIYTLSSQVNFLSWMNLSNGLFLYQPHWYQNIFGKINPIEFSFFLIPLLVFVNLMVNSKVKEIYFFIFVSLVSIFLIKGSQEPFGDIYSWLFIKIPGFNMFRDPSKFYILLCLSYSLLIGFSTQKIISYFPKKARGVLFLFLSAYFIFIIRPVWMGNMLGTFKPQKIPQDYLVLKNDISQDNNFSRSIWYPNRREYSYSSPRHPALDATLDIFHLRPFDIAISGTYDIFSYLEHPFTPQLFDVLGIKYVIASDSVKKYELSKSEIKDKKRLYRVLDKTKWLKKENQFSNISLYETNSSRDHFFLTQETMGVVGSDSLYWLMGGFPNFKLSQWSLVYLDDFRKTIKKSDFDNFDYLIFNNKDLTDLSFLLASRDNFLFPSQQVGDQILPDKSWIVKGFYDNVAWRDILAHKGFGNIDFDLGGGFVSADDYPQNLTFSWELKNDFQGSLYVRYFSNRKGGRFDIAIDGKRIKEMDTKTLRDNFIWEKTGDINLGKGKHKVSLVNINGFNSVNSFAFLTEEQREALEKSAKEVSKNRPEIYFYEGGEATKSGGLNIVNSGNYEILIQSPVNNEFDKVKINIGGNSLVRNIQPYLNGEKWYSMGDIKLESGNNQVTLDGCSVRNLILFEKTKTSFFDFVKQNSLSTLSYRMINPTKYVISVNLDKPATLVFSDSFHSSWQANYAVEKSNSFPVYSIINGFRINKTGQSEIIIEFLPQRLLKNNLIISLIGLLLTLVSLIFFKINAGKK